MIKADISPDESILHNLDTWCYEVGTNFENMNIDAAEDCIKYIDEMGLSRSVIDLGCGDGAATKVFFEKQFITIAVDINYKKLSKVPGPKIETDMLTFVNFFNKLGNVFSHHAFEHVSNIDEVIQTIGEKMYVGALYYVVVPARDYLHSVHHVVFESPEELLPPGLTPIKLEERERDEPEFICVAQKVEDNV